MKFFVPGYDSPDEAEKIYQATKKWAAETWVSDGKAIADRRIRRITFRDGRKEVRATVGDPDPLQGYIVIAILQTTGEPARYLICTATRGVFRGHPMVVKEHEVISTELFDS